MNIQYFDDTDTLYIELKAGAAAETEAVTDDLFLDFDAKGRVIGITIDNYSEHTDLPGLKVSNLEKVNL